tara:strand:- start:974 stop:1387 length:414 start_codon:yes stop_codon:yes gene_type:complete
MTSKESKGRFDCLIEKTEEQNSEKGEATFKKNTFKKEEGRFNFKNEGNDFDERNNFQGKRTDFGRDRGYYRRERNLNNFDRMRGATYGRPSGINYDRRYDERDSYNSFNRKRKDSSEPKVKPKKEFKITENDFPALG